MIGIFIYVIIAIALVASLGFSILQFNQSAERTAAVQRNASRMEALSAILRGNSAPTVPGGVPRLPAPVDEPPYEGSAARALLPVDIVGDDRTGWGARYGYCPFALLGGAAEAGTAVTAHGGGDYTITIAERAGRSYVVGTTDAPAVEAADGLVQPLSVMGFIVSPTPNGYDIPRCDEIIYRDGAYVIGRLVDGQVASPSVGGTVQPIFSDASVLSYVPAEFAPTIYVSQVGGGTGRSASDPMSLDEAIAWWLANVPPAITIELADGAYDLNGVDLDFASAQAADRITIRSGSATITGSTSGVASFSQQAEIRGVALEGIGVVAGPGARVVLEDGAAAFASARGGDVTVMSSTSLGSTEIGRSAVEVLSGSILLADAGEPLSLATNAAPAITLSGGSLEVAADLDTPAMLLWAATAGSLEIGRKADGTIPRRNGAELHATTSVIGSQTAGNTSAASCPAEHPYVIQSSCIADQGALRSSYKTTGSTEGWACWWSEDVVATATFPSPTAARVDLTCSATPAR